MIFDGAEAPEGMAESVRTRMISRLYHVGSSPETAAWTMVQELTTADFPQTGVKVGADGQLSW